MAVHAGWLQWPTGLGSKPCWLAGSFVSGYSSACFEIKFSGRHRGFNGVLFRLWPLANTESRGTQSSVPAWTTDNRWHTTACISRPLTALFACAATLGSAAYSARHARARPSDTRKERSRSIYTSYTPSDKPDDVALDYICPSHEAVHSASPWSRPQHWYMKRSRATSYK